MDESVETENDHEQKIKPHSPLVCFSSEIGGKPDYHSDVRQADATWAFSFSLFCCLWIFESI